MPSMNTTSNESGMYEITVTDEKMYRHQITEMLGRGGQGAVFRTSDRNVVIKALVDETTGEMIRDDGQYEAFKAGINEVRILNLPEGIHIAKPVHLLRRPYCGYVMRMLSDMVPIKSLMLSKDKSITSFYLETGGLRRRLQLLAEAAKVLSILHSLPVVYADISPENIFVSRDVGATEVWFIDSDNMRHTVDFSRPIFTPGYGAPEVVRRTGVNNTKSDVYSFALLAFEVLAQTHAFEGELVTGGGGWDDGDQDYNDLAAKGGVPWIEDEEDDANFSNYGIPRRIVLSSNMRKLFQATFGSAGRADSSARPSMRKWHEVLRQAADLTVTCPNCSATYYVEHSQCPFCEEYRSRTCLVKVSDWYRIENEEGIIEDHYVRNVWKSLDIRKDKEQLLLTYHVLPTVLEDPAEPVVEIHFGERYTLLRNLIDRNMDIVHGTRRKSLAGFGTYDCPDLDGAVLHIPLSETRSRHITFTMI